MDEELISKKDLLIETGISYGQLYRWKRKDIIPEDWFIKKSAYTGQETYFPKEKILERIQKIKELKDDLSLDELAEQFSLKPAEINMSKEEIVNRNIVTSAAADIYEENITKKSRYNFQYILEIFIFNNILSTGHINVEEAVNIIKNYRTLQERHKDKLLKIFYIRKYGIGTCIIGVVPCEFYAEEDCKIILNIEVSEKIEELKIKLNE
ncbi:DUF4004 family protein [Clostridium polynesiense]|uniref:DUF4004 family protein n=1 Tax=Clostridium polynesiense TaxID=1325933 RepID=UPI0005918061|nr:DUF4004 family protein [Clostridium polynesiense]